MYKNKYYINGGNMKNKTRQKKADEKNKDKKKLNLLETLKGIVYIVVFLAITTPLLFLFGPYDKTRKVILSTVLATRHAYLVNDLIPKATLDKMIGEEEEIVDSTDQTQGDSVDEIEQDIDKVKVKYTTGNDIVRYDIKDNPRFYAYILEIKNPTKIKVAMTKYLGKTGQKTSEMAEDHDAIAAINGGSFIDVSSDGIVYAGTGGEPGGFVISGGEVVYPKSGVDESKVENVVAFTENGTLIVGDHSLAELKELNVQEAMCFRKPNILINGVRQIKNKASEGYNPRTAVGQKEDGTVIFLVIDGRKISSPGATLYDVQEIMKSRGAINAGALDGGYSSTMYYDGEVINSPNAWNGERTVATAFYVEQ